MTNLGVMGASERRYRRVVKSQGGRSFGLFNYDSYVSFRAIGLIWGILRVDCRAGVLAHLVTPPCPLSLPCGRPIIKTWQPATRGLPGI